MNLPDMNIPITKEINQKLLVFFEANERISDFRIDTDLFNRFTDEEKIYLLNELKKEVKKNVSKFPLPIQLLISNFL